MIIPEIKEVLIIHDTEDSTTELYFDKVLIAIVPCSEFSGRVSDVLIEVAEDVAAMLECKVKYVNK